MPSDALCKMDGRAPDEDDAQSKPPVIGDTDAEACPKIGGRPRNKAEQRFRELLRDGAPVNAAKKRSKCSNAQALKVLTELFEVLRRAA